MHNDVKRKENSQDAVRIDLIYLVGQLACGRCGKELEAEVEAVRSPRTRAILDEQEFEVHCAQCGWEEKPLGKTRLRPWQVRPPR